MHKNIEVNVQERQRDMGRGQGKRGVAKETETHREREREGAAIPYQLIIIREPKLKKIGGKKSRPKLRGAAVICPGEHLKSHDIPI